MGIFGWLKKKLFGISDEEIVNINEKDIIKEDSLNGLDFKGAIDAHLKWKDRLLNFINGQSNENLKVDDVCVDNKCVLGKWIYGDGDKILGEKILELKNTHAAFHKSAGTILKETLEGNKDKALKLLEEGDYVTYSNRVKKLLLQLYVEMADRK